MNIRLRVVLALSLAALLANCGGPWGPTPTALPGWRSPVSELFVDESALPAGWKIGSPAGTTTDPTINHLAREWYHEGCSGGVFQSIWRAYTAGAAAGKYDGLRDSQFNFGPPADPGAAFIPLKPPEEIDFQSEAADEFYLACGWSTWAYCELVARYRNYVVEMRLDLQAEYEGQVHCGLTYPEIEAAIRAMDAKFAWALETLPTPVP